MIHVSIQYNKYRRYNQLSDCIITGEAFYRDNLYKGNEFIQLISSCKTEEQFIDRLKQLNGFYALIKHSAQQLFAAVDRVRSIPLFYGQKGNDFFLSDSAEWVRQQVENIEMDTLAREEFLLTGYVTGPDALFPDVKQLQAGEALTVIDNGKKMIVKTIRYYRFVHEYETQRSMEDLIEEHDQVLLRVFKRLIQLADGRTIVVPLSGGYDSRLIVLMLKRLEYDNIITFSYGRPGNKESNESHKVAESLGLRWEFVEYSNKLWYEWYHSEEYSHYAKFANGLASLPHIQDWPAVWQLKNKNLIPNDSIFVTGHTPMLSLVGKPTLGKSTADAILNKHYSLWNIDPKLKQLINARIKNNLNNQLNYSIDDVHRFYLWECTERQSKFIANAVRVYEFWGYEWYLPFWDAEFFNFCLNLGKEKMYHKSFFKKVVDELYSSYTSVDFKWHNDIHNPKKFISNFKKIVTNLIKSNGYSEEIAQKFYRAYHKRSEYYRHPLAWYGAVGKKFYNKHHTGGIETINSLLALQIIDEIGSIGETNK